MDRRTFVYQTSTLVAGSLVTKDILAGSPGFAKKKVAMVGTGDRGTGMWGAPVIK
jgi:hypothetical protein